MSKVTRIKTSKSGSIPSRPQPDGPSALEACQDKWEHLREDVKGKLWSQCPPEMVGDFMRAMAQYFVHNFHDDAVMKALQFVACSALKDPQSKCFQVPVSYLGSQASAVLNLTTQPEDKFDSEWTDDHTVTFDVATSATTEEGVREELGRWAEEDDPQTRMVFDPLASLPNKDIVALVKNIEQKVGREDLLVMSTVALTLLLWKECETTNAETAELTIRGLYDGDQTIRPGEKIVAVMTVNHLDNTMDTEASEDLNTYEITSKIGKNKM